MKVLFLTRSREIHSPIILEALLQDKRFDVLAVVVSGKLTKKGNPVQDILYAAKKSGWRYVFMRVREQLYFRFYPFFKGIGFDRLKGQRVVPIEKFAEQQGLGLIKVRDVNSRENVASIRKLQPDVILTCYFSSILGKEIMNAPRIGCVNVHRALLPEYRGTMPTFWVLANGERETGVTVHLISDNPKVLDAGWILAQKAVQISKGETVNSLSYKLSKACASVIGEALLKAMNRKLLRKLDASAKYYSWPTREAVKEFVRRGRRVF